MSKQFFNLGFVTKYCSSNGTKPGRVATFLNSQKPILQVDSNVPAAIYVDDNRRGTTSAAIPLDLI